MLILILIHTPSVKVPIDTVNRRDPRNKTRFMPPGVLEETPFLLAHESAPRRICSQVTVVHLAFAAAPLNWPE